jgi:bifunctional non-homologous end joining protein LigD
MYARAVEKLPEGPDWFYEIKLDGYRCLSARDSQGVSLWSRRENIFTTQFPKITKACEKLEPGTLLDGEIVALDGTGRPSFNLLQHHRSKASAIVFYAFDVLVYRAQSLLKVPLETRRKVLNDALVSVGDPIRLSEAFETAPADLIRVAQEQSLEGIIAKRKDSLYESGKRSGVWLKYRINRGQEFVIGGYRPGNHGVDALIVGYHEGKQLRYAGKVRAGFTPHVRREVSDALKPLHTARCPFVDLPNTKTSHWGAGITASTAISS